jgi:hypothetical protein
MADAFAAMQVGKRTRTVSTTQKKYSFWSGCGIASPAVMIGCWDCSEMATVRLNGNCVGNRNFNKPFSLRDPCGSFRPPWEVFGTAGRSGPDW